MNKNRRLRHDVNNNLALVSPPPRSSTAAGVGRTDVAGLAGKAAQSRRVRRAISLELEKALGSQRGLEAAES